MRAYGYPKKRLAFEHAVNFGRAEKRADIVIFDKDRVDTAYIDENLALEVDKIASAIKKDSFHGNRLKELEIKLPIHSVLGVIGYDAKQIIELMKNQNNYLMRA